MNTRDNQRGGIVVFAVVGVLLAGLLAGALYVGKQQTGIAKKDTPAPIAIDTEKEATEAAKGTEKTPKQEAESNPAQNPVKPAPQAQAPAKPAPTGAASTGPSVTSVANSGPSVVASTGPADMAFGIVIVTAISFAALAFIQSGLRLRRSALSR